MVIGTDSSERMGRERCVDHYMNFFTKYNQIMQSTFLQSIGERDIHIIMHPSSVQLKIKILFDVQDLCGIQASVKILFDVVLEFGR